MGYVKMNNLKETIEKGVKLLGISLISYDVVQNRIINRVYSTDTLTIYNKQREILIYKDYLNPDLYVMYGGKWLGNRYSIFNNAVYSILKTLNEDHFSDVIYQVLKDSRDADVIELIKMFKTLQDIGEKK
jgi:hypothetical protein